MCDCYERNFSFLNLKARNLIDNYDLVFISIIFQSGTHKLKKK